MQIGDVVRLKSGGPDMTIDKLHTNVNGDPHGRWTCVWFDGMEKKAGDFSADALMLTKE